MTRGPGLHMNHLSVDETAGFRQRHGTVGPHVGEVGEGEMERA
jgi:hypothetical protein